MCSQGSSRQDNRERERECERERWEEGQGRFDGEGWWQADAVVQSQKHRKERCCSVGCAGRLLLLLLLTFGSPSSSPSAASSPGCTHLTYLQRSTLPPSAVQGWPLSAVNAAVASSTPLGPGKVTMLLQQGCNMAAVSVAGWWADRAPNKLWQGLRATAWIRAHCCCLPAFNSRAGPLLGQTDQEAISRVTAKGLQDRADVGLCRALDGACIAE